MREKHDFTRGEKTLPRGNRPAQTPRKGLREMTKIHPAQWKMIILFHCETKTDYMIASAMLSRECSRLWRSLQHPEEYVPLADFSEFEALGKSMRNTK